MKFIHNSWPILLIIFIGLCVSLANYTPGTFLSGWDTLHPEFNFPLAFSRAIFGVFRPEEGVGAVAAHSQMADLPHIVISYLISAISSVQLTRYLFIFLCFISGGVGMFFFLSHLIPSKIVCFLGALFYMLNIGTVQNFYVPFEMFVVQYATLPFLFLFATEYFFTKTRSSLWGIILFCILSSPMAYAATLWYVTYGVFSSYLIFLSYFYRGDASEILTGVPGNVAEGAEVSTVNFTSDRTPKTDGAGAVERQDPLKRAFMPIFFMLLLNLYWILPNIYFVITHGKDVTLALTNQLFSEEAFLYNKAFGNIWDIIRLHTFYFGWNDFTQNGFSPLMGIWTNYLEGSFLKAISVMFFLFVCIGIVVAFLQKKKIFLSFIPAIIISLIFLFNANLPFSIYNLFEKIPLFKEAFRFPDDKILGTYTFVYSIFFAYGIFSLKRLIKNKLLTTIYYLLTTAAILAASFPVFTGNLISPQMRVNIPNEYFQLFTYLENAPNGRIATLPIQYLWGWEYYKWPFDFAQDKSNNIYQGSGFLSYGIPQSIMDRDFDRWNPSNETYYREMSFALYNQNFPLLQQTIHKYHISSILLDTSIISPGQDKKVLWYPQTQNLLSKLHASVRQFGNHLFLYTLPSPSSLVAFNTLSSGNYSTSDYVDTTFLKNGDYINDNNPSSSFFSVNHLGMIGNPSPKALSSTSAPFASLHLFVPTFISGISQNISLNDCELNPLAPSITHPLWSKELYFGYVRYISENGPLCDHISLPYPLNERNYILQITARNIEGLSLRVCISDPESGKCIIYTRLPSSHDFTTYDIFLPSFSNNKRFSVNLNTVGIDGTTSINDVKNISVLNSFPTPQDTFSTINTSTPLNFFSSDNNSLIAFNTSSSKIGFFQAYEPGWQLYRMSNNQYPITNLQKFFTFLFGKPVGQHVELDNWANGWIIPQDQGLKTNSYIIVFLPQYLEYLGFLVGGITLIVVVFRWYSDKFR